MPEPKPGDEMLVFDGSEEYDDIQDSRLPLLIAVALLVLATLAGVVWLAYSQGERRGRSEARILGSGQEQVVPPAGGARTVPYQGFKLYQQPVPLDHNADIAPTLPSANGSKLDPLTGTPVVPASPGQVNSKSASSGSYVLQIGAYTSQADADAAWKAYKARHAGLLSGYSDNVQQADLGAKGIWYRLRVGGIPDKQAVQTLCDKLKADGGACILGH